jgi:hypothetical protein
VDDFGSLGQRCFDIAVNLIDQRIEDPHLIAIFEKFLDNMSSDEAAAASYKDHRHLISVRSS